MLRKRKKIKKVHILLPILVLIILVSYGIRKFTQEKNLYKDNTKVIDTITQVLDLNTVKYNYSNIVTVKKDRSINDIKIPFSEKSFIIKYNGTINGGVKPEDIKIIKNTGDKIYIEVKKCRILNHYIDDENIYVYDIKSSVFNKVDINEVLKDVSKYKKEYEKKIIKEGFMDEVEKNTKSSLENMLKNMGYRTVVVSFK
ncbi:DUF4230 domain-containing protein [Asaccharospora irregularis]|uniref:DUF4230 domain-containing protein n=1 Tax=Asaccharospora irregularis DSM 2635 TaxID=1121321 RepID=A0A1M5QYS4_9FIRM|nr:DUF4230 domain-containing protein [Asaccharospora irregularis]SHH19091.1 Protein of unknown function [Asaccharospora irregularis DSM 2635]